MILLDAATAIGKDSSVSMEFMITILVGVVGVTANFFILKNKIDNQKTTVELKEVASEKRVDDMKSDHKEKIEAIKSDHDKEIGKLHEQFIQIKRDKRKLKEDLEKEISEKNQICHDRIDRANHKIDEFQAANNLEFKGINEKLNIIIGELKK